MPDGTPDRCTVSMDNVKLCGESALPDAPIPICVKHASALLAFMMERVESTVGDGTDFRQMRIMTVMADSQRRKQVRAAEARESDAVVYYIRVGDLVKRSAPRPTSRAAPRSTRHIRRCWQRSPVGTRSNVNGSTSSHPVERQATNGLRRRRASWITSTSCGQPQPDV